ncbi:hypothetical protein C8R44DRAFT_800995 [Mycena epipterygia]|nr:hypothetical protein C8R44DRAFT_800995 [Mycena epipterygia]
MFAPAIANWQAPKSLMPLIIHYLYQKTLGGTASSEVIKSLLAAIGEPDICVRGHLFAILRLLRRSKNEDKSVTQLCTEYISKRNAGGVNHIKEPTTSHSEPNVQDAARLVKRRRLNETNPAVIHNLVPTEKQLIALDGALKAGPIDASQYAIPERWHQLPFPFVYSYLPRDCFKLEPVRDEHDNHLFSSFDFMGREVFPHLVDAVTRLKTDGTGASTAFLLGTIGVGKSHLLAALTVFLRRQGKVVVYVPDCADLVMSPVRYMGAALLCAFSGQDLESRSKRNEIRALGSARDIEAWCRNQSALGVRFFFLVDQLDGLENQDMGMVSNSQREGAKSFLLSLYCGHICVLSSSANDQQEYEILRRGQRELVINFPQMSNREITSWMTRFSGRIPIFSAEELDWYNEYVGRVFLFYPPLLNHPNNAFSDVWAKIHDEPILRATRRNIQQFAIRALTKDGSVRNNYVAGARACITGTSTKTIRQDLIDHRCCFVDVDSDRRGRVESGLARRELFAFLEQDDRNLSLSDDWLHDGLANVIGSPPVVAFMIEKSTLASLEQGVAGPGLVNWQIASRHILPSGKSLPRDLPRLLGESGGFSGFLIIPEDFNPEDIDALYIKVDKVTKHALIIPIKVTLADCHKDSAARFYPRWQQWTAYFEGYTLETAFLWVVELFKPGSTIETEQQVCATQHVSYSQHFIHLRDIAPRVWDELLRAREKQQMRAETLEL